MAFTKLFEFMRGGDVNTISADVALYKGAPRVQVFDPQSGSLTIVLPDIQTLKLGGPHFYIINISSSFGLTVESFTADETFTLATEEGIVMSSFKRVSVKGWLGHIRTFTGSAIGATA